MRRRLVAMPREVLAEILQHELPPARVRLELVVPVRAGAEPGMHEAQRRLAAFARLDDPVGIERRLRLAVLARGMPHVLRRVEDVDLVLDAHALAPREPDAALFPTLRQRHPRLWHEPFRELNPVAEGTPHFFGGGVELDRDFYIAGVFRGHEEDSWSVSTGFG